MAENIPPRDLRDAQLRLHQTRAAYEALCRTLPWSVVPAEGYSSDLGHGDFRRTFPATSGYTEAQRAEVERLQALLRDLSITVMCHPWWGEVPRERVVMERMAWKRAPGAVSCPVGGLDERGGGELAAAA